MKVNILLSWFGNIHPVTIPQILDPFPGDIQEISIIAYILSDTSSRNTWRMSAVPPGVQVLVKHFLSYLIPFYCLIHTVSFSYFRVKSDSNMVYGARFSPSF